MDQVLGMKDDNKPEDFITMLVNLRKIAGQQTLG